MKILSIDPGTNKFGVSLLENDELVWTREIQLMKNDLKIRFALSMLSFTEILASIDSKIDYYAIETPFFGRNVATAIKLGEIRGIFMACIFSRDPNAKIIDISPLEVRRYFGISKSSDKEKIHDYLKMVFGDKVRESKEDALDSVAIALVANIKIKDDLKNVKQ